MLFNLQHIDGFVNCVERMKSEEHVESGLAELDFGRMLFANRHKFKFITPQGKRGNDYDFEITLDKWTICADVKCKLDDKDISRNIVLNELKGSRSQLPENNPGVFFIKVPQHWMETPEYETLLVETAQEFLRTTGRIVSVKYFIAPYTVVNGELMQSHYFKEVPNPRNRFDAGRKWELFSFYNPIPGTKNAMPLNWRRFVDFPNVLLKAEYEGTGFRVP
jgi:hypothetical protein